MKIRKAKGVEVNSIFFIYTDCRRVMENAKIFQWNEKYPSKALIKKDIAKGYLYVMEDDGHIIGAISISEEQEREYQSIDWKEKSGKIMVIHRLAVHPRAQKRGIGRRLMDFAEFYGKENKYTSIRLDAYSGNSRVLTFYNNRAYTKRGEVFFPNRKLPFVCYEKSLR